MEPYIVPLHSSSPPPLDDDDDGEAGSEDDEFGDFGGFCSPPGVRSTAPPSSLRKPPPTANGSFNHPLELSQTVPTLSSGSGRAQVDVGGGVRNAESTLHLTNGYAEGDPSSGAHGASVVATCSPTEETGFADFTVFTEQAAHPWCCGLAPLGSAEAWAGGAEGTNSAKRICAPGREEVMESEPRSRCAYKAKENVCTKIKHCERRDAAVVPPSQDHHQPQEPAAAAALRFPLGQPHFEEEVGDRRGDSWREMRYRLNYLQTAGLQEDEGSEKGGEKSLPQTISAYESASEDLASACDDFSFEGVSAEWEPNVSSLASLGDQSDLDRTDDEDEELGNNWHSHVFGNGSMSNLSQTEAEKSPHRCDQSASQETTATSDRPHSVTDEFAGFSDGGSEHRRDPDWVQTADMMVQSRGSLPPSDSFADFCSAPTQQEEEEDGGGEGSWAEFQDQRTPEVSSLPTDGSIEEEQDRVGQCGDSRRNSCQASLSCRVQQLLLASFPEVVVPPAGEEEEEDEKKKEEEEAFTLGALLHSRHLPESEGEEKMPELRSAQWVQQGLWWPHQDVHSAVGLQFQWGGSHTNRILLRCLGVDTRNIVFMGMKKQPVAVPAFASGLGMLEPTKDATPALCSTGYAAREPPGPQDTPHPSTDSVQELDWSRRGLSSSQDELGLPPVPHPHPLSPRARIGCFALNLDYFGPEEENRTSSSSSSSSSSNSPPPGVDRELYELTISKLEACANSRHLVDTLNRLMCDAERTSTSVRKPQQDEEVSEEARRVITGLPNLTFMKTKVLMFPSVLVPEERRSSVLE